MAKKNYLETLKSVLGCSILHYCCHSSKHSGATGPARPFILPRSGNENRAIPGLKTEPSTTTVVSPSTTTGGVTVSKAPSIPDQ